MKKTLEVVNGLVENGVIENYAIGGAMAALFYTEAVSSIDLDIFIVFKSSSTITYFGPVYDYLNNLGYKMSGQHVVIEGVPVDFLPAYNALINEALENSIIKTYEGVNTKVFSPEYLIVISLQTGRAKDFGRMSALMDSGLVDEAKLVEILKSHNLYSNWIAYVSK